MFQRSPQRPPSRFTPAQIDDIREAVLRYQMAQFPKMVYFLSTNRKEISPALIARFKGNPAVRPLNRLSPGARFKDKQTGEPGVHIWADEVRWISSSETKVHSGWLNGGRSGLFGYCRVVFQQSRWQVQKFIVEARA